MVLVNLARLHVPVKPAVDGLEGNTEFLGEFDLTDSAVETVGVESVNEISRHRGFVPHYNTLSLQPNSFAFLML